MRRHFLLLSIVSLIVLASLVIDQSIAMVGDVNADGKVDLKDVYAVAKAYGTSLEGPNPPGHMYNPNCDVNDDRKIDLKDYYIVCKHYGHVDPDHFAVFRKILKVKTTGSSAGGNLEPDINLPAGVNLATLEYNETAGWVIIEIWGTDHPLCEHPISMSDLDSVATQQTVMEVLVSHPLSPEILGTFGISRSLAESVDETNKLVAVNGIEYSFVRIEGMGSMDDAIILIEG